MAVSAAAARDDEKADKLDPAKLVGTYKITDGTKAGEKIGDDAKKWVVTITKKTINLKGEDGIEFEFTYKLDAKADPATIDMVMTKPKELSGKAKGIISSADGEVKLCYHPKGEELPKKFESTKDNGYHLFTLKKEKGDEKKPTAVAK